MAIDVTKYATKRIHVSPTSSILHLRIEDVDCSSTIAFEKPPLDGQFIFAPGVDGCTDADDAVVSHANAANVAAFGGSALAMVWLSQFKTDQDALGSARIPVVRGPLRFKTKLFAKDAAVSMANSFPVGQVLTVIKSPTSIDSTDKRLVLCPISTAGLTGGTTTWVVGFVTRRISEVAGSEEIEVQLYDTPRLVTTANS